MHAESRRSTAGCASVVLALLWVVGCDTAREPSGPTRGPAMIPPGALAAKATGLTVTASNPSFGEQGQTNEQVTITGTGFTSDSKAAWLRNGVVDTTITVTSTQYVSPTTLTATINISSKSPVDYRDVRVTANGGRTQGIGSLLFEVTQAVQIAGTSWVRSINDNGEATGTLASGDGVFYYSVQTGHLETVSTTGTGYDISTTGTTIVGSGGVGGGFPYVYVRVGGAWQGTALPIGPTSTSGIARLMLTDGTGQAVLIGGIEYGTGAVTWTWQAASGSWKRSVLPGNPAEVRHRAVSARGILGGTTSGPAVWMPNGTGGYTVTTLANAGAVNGVRWDGGMLVGFTSGPVYWLAQPGGTWSAPVTVAGGCNGIKDIADAGRIILNDCPFRTKGQTFAAHADAPYASLSRLGGFGPQGNVGFASGISHGGHFAGGNATVNNQSVGIYWTLP